MPVPYPFPETPFSTVRIFIKGNTDKRDYMDILFKLVDSKWDIPIYSTNSPAYPAPSALNVDIRYKLFQPLLQARSRTFPTHAHRGDPKHPVVDRDAHCSLLETGYYAIYYTHLENGEHAPRGTPHYIGVAIVTRAARPYCILPFRGTSARQMTQ